MGMTLAKRWEQEGFEKGKAFAEQFLQQGMQQGVQQGIKEGYQKAQIAITKNIAAKLFDRGMSAAEIAAITDLSINEVEKH